MDRTTLRACYACGATRRTREARCDCGEPLWIRTGTDEASDGWPTDAADSLWRYADLLAVDSPDGGLGTAAGGTPLVRTPTLDTDGVEVHVKLEGANPTGTFKDRGTAVGVAAAADRGETLGTVSHGNMATSVAAHAAARDLPCVVLVPDDIPDERLSHVAQFDPTLLRVSGDYGRLYERSLDLGAERGIRFLNSDVPLRVEGQKTLAYECCEAFAPEVPDAVVLPVSSGGNASAVWKGLRDLRAAGRVDRLPRLYLVQAAACAPIAEAFERGDDAVTPVDGGDTVAYSIANADPPSGTRALVAARATGGGVLAVDDDAILAARDAFARAAGLSVEPASATTLAALRTLRDRGAVDAGETVVLVATGTGFRDPPSPAAPVETVPSDALAAHLDDRR